MYIQGTNATLCFLKYDDAHMILALKVMFEKTNDETRRARASDALALSQTPKTLAHFPAGLKGEQDENRILYKIQTDFTTLININLHKINL